MCDVIEEGVVDVSIEDLIKDLLERNTHLNEEMKRVIRLRFGLEDGRRHTMKEVSDELGISPQRVRWAENRVLPKPICPPRRRKKLKDFLD